MTTTLSPFQTNGLKKLTTIKARVHPDYYRNNTSLQANLLSELTQIICEHQLADSDYSTLPEHRTRFKTDEDWLNQFTVGGICKYFTYLIWTETVMAGNLAKRVEDSSVYLLVVRLEALLSTPIQSYQ